MDNIKEALEYAVELSHANTYEVGNEMYSDKKLYRIDEREELIAGPMRATTLTSMIDYIKQNVDKIDLSKTVINIISPTEVTLTSVLNKDKNREDYITSKAIVPRIDYGHFYENESFNILMQSAFLETKDKELILKVITNIVDEEKVTTADNGVHQVVTAKMGIANVENVQVPNPVELRPFRSFPELNVVASKFIFRMKKGGYCALFEADGGAWKLDYIEGIKEYLQEQLRDIKPTIMIIG